MKKNIFLCLLWLCVSFSVSAAEPIRVACIGNSITYGARITDRDTDSYPAVLGSLLGKEYQVENFGLSGRTLSRDTGRPYVREPRYQEALAYTPDIVVIKLGTNDAQPRYRTDKESVQTTLNELIDSFLAVTPHTRIYLCLPVPAFGINDYTIDPEYVAGPIRQWISEVAHERELPLIDLYTALSGQEEHFPDRVHPNEAGARLIAGEVYRALTQMQQ
ncbi:MAG: GDSL-type esterase/lipase family protein [Bacteroides sp.]|nr:GDSL-type esterase/lipase family protein [Bacteroides sp.]